MKPMKAPKKPDSGDRHSSKVPDVVAGDHIYFRLHDEPTHGRVIAHGEHGVTVRHAGEKRNVHWKDTLGYKARSERSMKPVDTGEDGAIMQGARGRRKYVEGYRDPSADGDGFGYNTAGPNEEDENNAKIAMGSGVRKAMPIVFITGDPGEFAKALKNRPGLSLQATRDKSGKATKRWKKTGPDEKKDRKKAGGDVASDAGNGYKAGDKVRFKAGDFAGSGEIVGKPGKDGAHMRDSSGRTHRVGWKEVSGHDTGDAPAEKPATAAVAPSGEDPETIAKGLFPAMEIKGLPDAASQPVGKDDKDALFEMSGPALEDFKTWLDKGKGIASQLGYQTMSKSPDDVTPEEWSKPGGMLFIAPLKGEKRAQEKVDSDYGGDWSKLIDTVRGTIAVDTMDDVKAALDKLTAGGMKLARQPKNRFADPTAEGYRDVLMNITLPNGLVGELQVHVRAMTEAKNEGHPHYEVCRAIKAKHTDKKTGKAAKVETWDQADQAPFMDAFHAQKSIYSAAWAKIQDSGTSKEMRKAGDDGIIEPFLKGLGAMAEYEYFEHDNAYFRREKGLSPWVDDVRHGGKWSSYTGDALKPYAFGSKVSQEEAERERE